MWQTLSRGDVWRGEFTNRRKDGSLFEEKATISPIKNEHGEVVSYVAVKREVTAEVALQKQLLQAQKMEAIGTLAGGIAHDFNNLLMVILGYADLLLQRKQPHEPDREKLQAMRRAARDGADLVNRILTFSKRVESNVRPIDLNEEIRRIEKLMMRVLPKMIGIQIVLSEDLKIINADPSQIEQIILNLSVNAHHAMPEGGRLVIETSNVKLGEDYCQLHLDAKPGDYVLLSVSDTGTGIEPELLDRIFEPFFTTKQDNQGTGLGLSMVHGVVAQHGGHIRCYSEPGVGTTFRIYFPLASSQLEGDVALTHEMPAVGTETILLVDDDIRIRDLAAEMLMLSGYDVVSASNGQEALGIYRKRKEEIALVILDLVMPGMSGTQCLKELLKIDPKVRVLISSGYSANGPGKEITSAGARGFITKPYDMKEMRRAIRGIIDAND
jgi:signal transduction histidine kinase/ActR/RegA family two-component response regulator